MSTRVEYQLRDGIAEIRMDDGKVNALSLEMFGELGAAFDRAKADRADVVLRGREPGASRPASICACCARGGVAPRDGAHGLRARRAHPRISLAGR
jgi:enoyl-CoA hydratase/carnithine racemase